jgi:hypothetical protein
MSAFAAASMACDSRGCFAETAAIAPRDHLGRRRMKALSCLVAFTVAICGLVVIELPASATAANITGTWDVTIHYPPPDGDYLATYVLKQDGEKITGTYHGMYGPADVTGTIKANDVTMSVTVHGSTAHFSGEVTSATKMNGTVTGTSDQPRKWSAEKKK